METHIFSSHVSQPLLTECASSPSSLLLKSKTEPAKCDFYESVLHVLRGNTEFIEREREREGVTAGGLLNGVTAALWLGILQIS